ncbi:MAG TPA: hypothetical protein VGL58_05865 [Caulobacteraceae bacterium]|jgi:hypothetical protein
MASYLWIGGTTDAGKTTQARRLALFHTLALLECDRRDAAEHERIAAHSPAYRAFLEMTPDERWVQHTPEWLLANTLESHRDRFPLILEDAARLARRGRPVLIEGWDLTPELVAPLLEDPRRAVWMIPTETFKRRSWERRGKPAWKSQVSDPELGAANAFGRDVLLGEEIERQARALGFDVMTVDGSLSEDETTHRLEARFAPFLESD